MEKVELKSCPFCGGQATMREYSCGHGGNGEFSASYEVKCSECGIKFNRESRFRLINGQSVFSVNGYDECVEAWNRRTKDD